MTAGLRKVALTAHVAASVGWLGAVCAFLALALSGVLSADAAIVRAAYIGMHLTTWYVIVAFCLASFLTGVIEGLGTPWGLVRHYWVLLQLVLTLLRDDSAVRPHATNRPCGRSGEAIPFYRG